MDCIYVLEKGKLVEQGTLQTLLEQKKGIFYQMWQLERQQIDAAMVSDNRKEG